jgi:hypothetical protein
MVPGFPGNRLSSRSAPRFAQRPRILPLRLQRKPAIVTHMHFSRHILQLHSTFSLLAALKLRYAR